MTLVHSIALLLSREFKSNLKSDISLCQLLVSASIIGAKIFKGTVLGSSMSSSRYECRTKGKGWQKPELINAQDSVGKFHSGRGLEEGTDIFHE